MGKAAFNSASIQHKEDFLIYPEEILIDETTNARFEPHTKADILKRAVDMVVRGQLAPCAIYKALEEDGKAALVFGFLRAKAALLINEKIWPAGGVSVNTETGDFHIGQKDGEGWKFYPQTKQFKLWCARREGNPLQHLKDNIKENLERKSTTVMDMVHNQSRMLLVNNGDYAEVAELYGTDVQTIKNNQMLMNLSKELQLMIHRGVITAESGRHLLTIPEADRKAAIDDLMKEVEKQSDAPLFDSSEQNEGNWLVQKPGDEATHVDYHRSGIRTGFPENAPKGKKGEVKGKGKQRTLISTKSVKNKVRKIKEAKGQRGPGLSMSELMGFFSQYTGPDVDPEIPEAIKDFAGAMMKFRRSEISERQMYNALWKLYETKPEKARAAAKV